MNFTTTVPNNEADELFRFTDLLLSILTLVVLPVQYKLSWMTEAVLSGSSCKTKQKTIKWLKRFVLCTSFAVHYKKISNHLRETATNCAKIHSFARKNEHLRINQIQLRFLHFNQHSITLLGIHTRHWAHRSEKYTFINAKIKVINTILKVNRDNWHTLKCKHYSLTFLWHCLQFNSILDNLFWMLSGCVSPFAIS